MERITEQKKIISVEDPIGLKIGLGKARDILLSGGALAFPTESFYGLGVNAMDEKAVRHLFRIKKRDLNNPILILIPSPESLNEYVRDIPDVSHELIKQFWPGGLTLIFKAGPKISPLLTSDTGKIGVRLSSHPIATALAQTINSPITGTSANLSGKPSCIKATDVLKQMGDKIELILDGGETDGGKGSTILDVTKDPPQILREGMIDILTLKKHLYHIRT